MAHDNRTRKKIYQAIGTKVKYSFPVNEGRKKGILKDRIVINSNPRTSGVPYWDVVDLIEFPEELHKQWIRIGYYRGNTDNLVWGSQTTISEPIKVWKRILVQTAKQIPWFHELLKDVMKELK
jgi:hypothetical protein